MVVVLFIQISSVFESIKPTFSVNLALNAN